MKCTLKLDTKTIKDCLTSAELRTECLAICCFCGKKNEEPYYSKCSYHLACRNCSNLTDCNICKLLDFRELQYTCRCCMSTYSVLSFSTTFSCGHKRCGYCKKNYSECPECKCTLLQVILLDHNIGMQLQSIQVRLEQS